jgi:hypothetical protein
MDDMRVQSAAAADFEQRPITPPPATHDTTCAGCDVLKRMTVCMTYKPSNELQHLCGAWCSLFLRELARKNGDLNEQHNNTGWQQRWHTENSTKRSMMSSLDDERHRNSTAYLAAT